MQNKKSSVLKIIIYVIFIIALGIGIYYGYLYFSEKKNNNNSQGTQAAESKVIMGTVENITGNEIEIKVQNPGGDITKKIEADSNTKYFKVTPEPANFITTDITFSDIKIGNTVSAELTDKSKNDVKIASKIYLNVDNYYIGMVKSISNSKIVVNVVTDANKEQEVIINKDTAYMTQIMPKPDSNGNSSSQQVKINPPSNSNFGDIQIGEQVNIYLVNTKDITPKVAKTILRVITK